jgi:hypothetical protein
MVEPLGNLGRHKRKRPSRVVVGFNRLGIVLGAPFLLIAAVLAFLQWESPTGRTAMKLPEGIGAWVFGDDADEPAKQIMAKQRAAGFDLPAGFMLVGIPTGMARQDGVDWTKFQLPDGRKIGIASTEAKKVKAIAMKFLLREQAAGRALREKDQIEIDGVQVAFLDWGDQDPWVTSPWLVQQHDWTWALICLFLGVGLYLAMRALGWVIDGFLGPRREEPDANRGGA